MSSPPRVFAGRQLPSYEPTEAGEPEASLFGIWKEVEKRLQPQQPGEPQPPPSLLGRAAGALGSPIPGAVAAGKGAAQVLDLNTEGDPGRAFPAPPVGPFAGLNSMSPEARGAVRGAGASVLEEGIPSQLTPANIAMALVGGVTSHLGKYSTSLAKEAKTIERLLLRARGLGRGAEDTVPLVNRLSNVKRMLGGSEFWRRIGSGVELATGGGGVLAGADQIQEGIRRRDIRLVASGIAASAGGAAQALTGIHGVTRPPTVPSPISGQEYRALKPPKTVEQLRGDLENLNASYRQRGHDPDSFVQAIPEDAAYLQEQGLQRAPGDVMNLRNQIQYLEPQPPPRVPWEHPHPMDRQAPAAASPAAPPPRVEEGFPAGAPHTTAIQPGDTVAYQGKHIHVENRSGNLLVGKTSAGKQIMVRVEDVAPVSWMKGEDPRALRGAAYGMLAKKAGRDRQANLDAYLEGSKAPRGSLLSRNRQRRVRGDRP